jgi:partner of Y14 and mago protein
MQSVRKQIKIRPGYTPQEDVRRFRGTKQTQMEVNALPKGHIIGWAPPPRPTAESASKPMSKSAKKNAKRREKKPEKKEVPEDWEEEEVVDGGSIPSTDKGVQTNGGVSSTKETVEADHTQDTPNWAAAPDSERKSTPALSTEDTLAAEVQKMGLS